MNRSIKPPRCTQTLQSASPREGGGPQSPIVSAFVVPAWMMLPAGIEQEVIGRSERGGTIYEAHLIRNHAASPRHRRARHGLPHDPRGAGQATLCGAEQDH